MAEKYIQYVDIRLQQWADWFSRGNLFGLSYPPQTIEYRLMVEGLVQRTTGQKSLPTNERAEEVELLIKEMADDNFTMAEVLRKYYFSQKELPEGSVIQHGAKELQLSVTRFRYYLDTGRHWLAGRLNVMKKQNY